MSGTAFLYTHWARRHRRQAWASTSRGKLCSLAGAGTSDHLSHQNMRALVGTVTNLLSSNSLMDAVNGTLYMERRIGFQRMDNLHDKHLTWLDGMASWPDNWNGYNCLAPQKEQIE